MRDGLVRRRHFAFELHLALEESCAALDPPVTVRALVAIFDRPRRHGRDARNDEQGNRNPAQYRRGRSSRDYLLDHVVSLAGCRR